MSFSNFLYLRHFGSISNSICWLAASQSASYISPGFSPSIYTYLINMDISQDSMLGINIGSTTSVYIEVEILGIVISDIALSNPHKKMKKILTGASYI